MALQLEETIMREIGLGNNYRWFNGSGSCEYIRHDAASKIAGAIKTHHDNGEEIALPDASLIALVKQVSSHGDDSRYSLTNTWQAASYVIAHHIHIFGVDPSTARRQTGDLAGYIKKNYLSCRIQTNGAFFWDVER